MCVWLLNEFIYCFIIEIFVPKAKHNRSYSANEQNLRKENLRKSLAAIAQHILDSASRPTTFNVGLNSLSDKVSINQGFSNGGSRPKSGSRDPNF
jgi:hypothetical protein